MRRDLAKALRDVRAAPHPDRRREAAVLRRAGCCWCGASTTRSSRSSTPASWPGPAARRAGHLARHRGVRARGLPGAAGPLVAELLRLAADADPRTDRACCTLLSRADRATAPGGARSSPSLFVLLGGRPQHGRAVSISVYGGFYADGDESTRADAAFDTALPTGPHNLVVVAEADLGGVDSADAARRPATALTELPREASAGISSVVSYWSAARPGPALRGRATARWCWPDRRRRGPAQGDAGPDLPAHPRRAGRACTCASAASPPIEREVTEQSQQDLRRMELLATPVVAVVLLLVFGSLVASLLPLVIGLTAIVGTMLTLRLLSLVTDVSHVLAQHRDRAQPRAGHRLRPVHRDPLPRGARHRRRRSPAAVATTLATAGRTVLFSALTVALSLSSLLVFPLYYLRSFAYAGIAVVGFAALSAVVAAARRADCCWAAGSTAGTSCVGFNRLRRGGHRREASAAPLPRPAPGPARVRRSAQPRPGPAAGTGWRLFVMRRPVLARHRRRSRCCSCSGRRSSAPASRCRTRRACPADSESAQVGRPAARRSSPRLSTDAMYVVSPEQRLTPTETARLRRGGLSAVAGVAGGPGLRRHASPTACRSTRPPPAARRASTAPTPPGSASRWRATRKGRRPQATPWRPSGRSTRPPRCSSAAPPRTWSTPRRPWARRCPWALALVAGSTLVLLFLFTGSVLIPVKAVLLNLLSLTATFGAAVWIFQDGHLRWLLGDFQIQRSHRADDADPAVRGRVRAVDGLRAVPALPDQGGVRAAR